MSFSGGVYTLPGPALVTGEVVSATENNQFRNDVAGAFNLTFLRNGTSTATANLPMGGYKLTGLGAPSTNGDALSYGAAAVVTTLTSTSLTATRVPYAGTGGLLQDASTFTFDGTTLTAGGFSGPHNGTVGATTPNTGAFTTLSASSTVSGTGFSNYLASPPAIGGTAAAAGSFTTLTTSSTVTVNGGTANGVAYLNGSKVLTTGSALTFDGTTFVANGAGGVQSNVALTVTGGTNGYKTLYLSNYANAANNWNYIRSDSGLLSVYATGSNSLSFGASGSEQMRLTSTGLGIGTSSPSQKLTVAGSMNLTGRGNTFAFLTPDWRMYNSSSGNAFVWDNYSTEIMRLDYSGNLGLGVTPSAWNTYKAMQVGVDAGSAFVAGYTDDTVFGNSAYFSSGWKYSKTSVLPTIYRQASGRHEWYTAPSGTAGNAISFTQPMTLDASGNLLVGTTAQFNSCKQGLVFNGATNIGLAIKNSDATVGQVFIGFYNSAGTNIGAVTQNATNTVNYATSSDYRLKENIQPMQNALGVVAQLNPVTYTWKADGSDGQGFIAHELQSVVPDCVTGEKDAVDEEGKPVYQGIDTSFLVGILTKAIQELKAELDATKAEVAALKGN